MSHENHKRLQTERVPDRQSRQWYCVLLLCKCYDTVGWSRVLACKTSCMNNSQNCTFGRPALIWNNSVKIGQLNNKWKWSRVFPYVAIQKSHSITEMHSMGTSSSTWKSGSCSRKAVMVVIRSWAIWWTSVVNAESLVT